MKLNFIKNLQQKKIIAAKLTETSNSNEFKFQETSLFLEQNQNQKTTPRMLNISKKTYKESLTDIRDNVIFGGIGGVLAGALGGAATGVTCLVLTVLNILASNASIAIALSTFVALPILAGISGVIITGGISGIKELLQR